MYRIVHNERSGSFRVERRGLLGWAFVTDPATRDYLSFRDLDEARTWVRQRARADDTGPRRWKVVSDCSA